MTGFVLGFDVGGTGARGALAPLAAGRPAPIAHARRVVGLRRGADGIDGAAAAAVVVALADELTAGRSVRVAGAAVGCAGAADLGDDLRTHLAAALDVPVVVVCSDLLTAFLGGLGGTAGVTLAVGTGAAAIGGDLKGEWRRADGWGDVVGDLGGGAWLGRAGITAALRAHDGRSDGSSALLGELTARYGDPRTLIRELYGRDDRAGFLAGFAPAVLGAVDDEVACRIRTAACRHLAETAAAARPSSMVDVPFVTTGALLEHHHGFRAELVGVLDSAFRVRPAVGTACDGALRLAAMAVGGSMPLGAEELGAFRLG